MGSGSTGSSDAGSDDGDSIKISVNILYTKAGEVVLAECGKDFVDFLVGLTQLPLASAIKLLKDGDKINGQGKSSRGLANILESVSKSNSRFLSVSKGPLLDPRTRVASTTPPLLKQPGHAPEVQSHLRDRHNNYRCHDCKTTVYQHESYCNDCTRHRQGDFVKGTATYIVTNELEFFPTSFLAGTRILTQKGIKSFDDLLCVEFILDADKALELVKASISSDRPLSDAFALPPDQIMSGRPCVDVALLETVE